MNDIECYKSIAPGKIIAHMIRKDGRTQQDLARELGVQRQVISAIVTGRRDIPEKLSYKLDDALGFETGFFLVIQAYYKARTHQIENKADTGLTPTIRRAVFWDIDMDKLDWTLNKDFIIERVNQRGNREEIERVLHYYDS